jgi:very-short-patch-repair endonuclease
MGRIDGNSELENKFLKLLYETKRKLPDQAQIQLKDYYCMPDFYYNPNICIFCDGSVHDTDKIATEDSRVRRELREKGYRVISIRYDRDLEDQVAQYSDVFGEGGQ